MAGFGFSQSLGQLRVAILLRPHCRGVASIVYGGGVGLGLKKHVNNRLTAFARGVVEGCPPIVARGIWLGFGLKQLGGDSLVATVRGKYERGIAVFVLSFDVGLEI